MSLNQISSGRLRTVLLAAVSAAALPVWAHAANDGADGADAGAIEEVVVTAERRES